MSLCALPSTASACMHAHHECSTSTLLSPQTHTPSCWQTLIWFRLPPPSPTPIVCVDWVATEAGHCKVLDHLPQDVEPEVAECLCALPPLITFNTGTVRAPSCWQQSVSMPHTMCQHMRALCGYGSHRTHQALPNIPSPPPRCCSHATRLAMHCPPPCNNGTLCAASCWQQPVC
jgi:hypothetical protein